MRRLLTTTALALLLSAPVAMTLHAQESGGSTGGGSTTGGSDGGGETTGGNTGGTSGTTDTESGTTSGAGSGNETGGTTGKMTTTPEAKTDDAVGTRESAATTGDWGTTTGGDLVGKTVYGSNGEEIGQIEDIVTRGTTTGPEALVGVGGFLGIGERDVAIPLSQLRIDGDRVTTSMTKESLGEMQPYEESGYTPWDRSRAVGQ